jgi:hypothetical protein
LELVIVFAPAIVRWVCRQGVAMERGVSASDKRQPGFATCCRKIDHRRSGGGLAVREFQASLWKTYNKAPYSILKFYVAADIPNAEANGRTASNLDALLVIVADGTNYA